MPTALKYPTSTNAVQKTLDAALLAGATASVTLNSVVGIQNKAGVFVVDRVDANGTATPSKREYVTFTGVSGSTLTTLTRNADGGGTDQDHAVGAIVEFVSDVLQEQAILDALLLVVTTAGVLNKATGAEINTGTEDAKIVTPKAVADSNVVITDKVQTLSNKTLDVLRSGPSVSTLTIASGAITITGSYHTVLGEGAASDTLTTINGGVVGDFLVLRQGNNAQDITFAEGANIVTDGGTSFTLADTDSSVLLFKYAATLWVVFGYSR